MTFFFFLLLSGDTIFVYFQAEFIAKLLAYISKLSKFKQKDFQFFKDSLHHLKKKAKKKESSMTITGNLFTCNSIH